MQVSQTINAPPESVWKILIDTELWPVWGPSLTAVDSPERLIGPGLKGRLKTVVGLWLPFEITEYRDQNYWHWKVAGLPATGHRVKSLGPKVCEVIFEIPYGAFPYKPVCWRALHNIARLAVL